MKAGRSTDPVEFLNKAIYHYMVARDLGEEYTRQEIDQLIAEGLYDIESGNVIDGEEGFRQLRAHSAERQSNPCDN